MITTDVPQYIVFRSHHQRRGAAHHLSVLVTGTSVAFMWYLTSGIPSEYRDPNKVQSEFEPLYKDIVKTRVSQVIAPLEEAVGKQRKVCDRYLKRDDSSDFVGAGGGTLHD